MKHDYMAYVRAYGADIDFEQFIEKFWERIPRYEIKIPKALEHAMSGVPGIAEAARAYREARSAEWQQEMFAQRQRVVAAERKLLAKHTKAAENDVRVGTKKVAQLKRWLGDLDRTSIEETDGRFFAGWHVPVMIVEGGRRVVKLMRYRCRPAGKPAYYDSKFPGTFNARRDNLDGFWAGQWGHTHGLMLVDAFYEHVNRHNAEGRELRDGEAPEDVVIAFEPNTHGTMLVACLWSHWEGEGEAPLDSFAFITDDPPPEVSAAGHDRCVIPIKAQHVDAWLNPDPSNKAALSAILDDRERPYYEHRIAEREAA